MNTDIPMDEPVESEDHRACRECGRWFTVTDNERYCAACEDAEDRNTGTDEDGNGYALPERGRA